MIKAVKLYLLKRYIGYRSFKGCLKTCNLCIAWKDVWFACGYCDRYKLEIKAAFTCNHFTPKEYNQTISKKERVELEKAKNHIEGLFNDLKKMIYRVGTKK